MKIKLVKQYFMSAAGSVLDVAKPIADLLILRGVANEIQDNDTTDKRSSQPKRGKTASKGR